MVKWIMVIAATVSICSLDTSDVLAQKDAGAKMRGESTTRFWHPKYRVSRPASCDCYSCLSRELSVRDDSSSESGATDSAGTVVITQNPVKLMSGRSIVATIPQGRAIHVRKATKGWLGAEVEVDGKTFKGWIWGANVTRQDPLTISGQQIPRFSGGGQVVKNKAD